MAKIIGRPGHRQATVAVRGTLAAAFGLPAAVGAIIVYAAWLQRNPRGMIGALAVCVFLALVGWRWIRVQLRMTGREMIRYVLGAQGEVRTAARLAELSDSYLVFNEVPLKVLEGFKVPYSIGHVVVGPTGVFVVETRNLPDAVAVSGELDERTRRHAQQMWRNSQDLAEALDDWSGGRLREIVVEPVLAVTHARPAGEGWLSEGDTLVVPLELLGQTITGRRGSETDGETVRSIARTLFERYPEEDRKTFAPQLEALAVP